MSGLLDKLRATRPGFVPAPRLTAATVKPRFAENWRATRGEVEWSPDLERIMGLPRRTLPDAGPIVRDLTAKLKRPEGTMTLRDLQALVLSEAPVAGGGLALMAIGSGKTLTGMLLPMVMPQCERAVLLIPPDLRPQFYDDWKRYGQHWKLPNLAGEGPFVVGRPVLHLMTYAELSHKKGTDALTRINPDFVEGDEIQAVRNIECSRGSRFFEFFPPRPWARFVGMTASITASSACDFFSTFVIALGENAPCPVEERTAKEWASALDPTTDEPLGPGMLQRFCLPGESVRSGIRRRLVDTLGVLASTENELEVELVFTERKPPPMPAHVLEAYWKLKRKDPKTNCYTRPDGEPLEDQLDVQACARQLAVGLYLRWIFPHGEPPALINTWYEIRAAWTRELRAQLQDGRKMFMDSPALCEEAAIRYYDGGCEGCTRGPKEPHQQGCEATRVAPLWDPFSYPAWREIRDLVYHESETVWMDDWIAQDAAAWARENIGIVWTEHPQFGMRVAELAGIPYFGAGKEAHEEIRKETGARSFVASIESHSRGKNLQFMNKNLIVQPPSSAEMFEQCCGRTHRSGQSVRVTVDYYCHTEELENALNKAQERATFIEEMIGSPQKLNYATWTKAA